MFALKAEGEKHHTNHTIDNGVIAVDKASLFVSPFLGTFDIISKNNSCATLQKYEGKQHVCHYSNGKFGNHGDPGRSAHDEKQMVDSRSMEDYSLSLLRFSIVGGRSTTLVFDKR